MSTSQAPVSPLPPRSRTSFRLVPVPSTEPPYETTPDTLGPAEPRASGRGGPPPRLSRQGALALAFVLPSGAPALPDPQCAVDVAAVADAPAHAAARPALRAVREAADPVFAPQRTTRTVLPNPRSWAALLGQAVVEVLAGHRPAAQLARWTTSRVHTSLTTLSLDARGQRAANRQGRAVVRSVRVFEPADGVAEAAVVVRESRRCWAMALRLEGLDGRWMCTALMVV